MSAPRIAFLGFHSGPGGIGRVMANLMNALAAEGIRVDALISRADAADAPLLDSGVRLVSIGEGKRLACQRLLVKYLNRQTPKVVITNKDWATEALILAKLFTRHRPCHVIRVGTTISQLVRGRPFGKRFTKKAVLRLFYRQADGIIGNSQGVVDDLVALTGVSIEHTRVIHNPTVTTAITQRANEPVPHPWLSGEGPPVLLAVGRLVVEKDYSTLIRAFASVRQQRACRLIILGEGKLRRELEGLASSLGVGADVDLPGFCENPFAMMRAADLFVLSSSREGFPNVLAEAMAAGAAVVATDCPSGPREILEGGKHGPLVPVGDANRMAEAIEEILDHPPNLSALQERAAQFTPERVVHDYMAALGFSPAEEGLQASRPLCPSVGARSD